jgi:exodeoxyribonuclease VII large subunit
MEAVERPDGIPGSALTGPWAVGQYAARLRERLREFARVQVFGEVFGFKAGRAKVWFELRDATGALPCSMWRKDFDALGLGELAEGARVVAAGGCDYYPGSRTASPSFSFAVTELRVAGEGDLLAQLEQLRRRLHAEGLFEPQKALARPALPRCIGVVTGESGKARDDVVAGLRRRGWAGRVVWAFAPVQDRHAAPAVTRALQDLAACPEVDVVVVARGGGSLADLFAFCDETLCRTVALLRVPVIASVGHHTDRTLLDDVAAVACSTPTHAAEAAVPVDCGAARAALAAAAARLERHGRRAVVERARTLARLSRAPAHHVARHRARLHQLARELRAVTRRRVAEGDRAVAAQAASLARKSRAGGIAAERAAAARGASLARKSHAAAAAAERAARANRLAASTLERTTGAALERRRRDLARLRATLAAHDPQRTLERGYALLEGERGEPVTSAAAARAQPALTLRLHDGRVRARPEDDAP